MLTIIAATAGSVISSGIAPTIAAIALFSSAFCTLMIVIGGYQYITSSGNPEKLIRAKKIIRNALIGLVIVLTAALISNFLKSAYSPAAGPTTAHIPSLNAITPNNSSDGLIGIIIKAITGVLASIIETVATPFLKALSYFTSGTPLVASNHSVFNLWISTVGIADALIVLVIMLLGLHVMGFLSLGLEHLSVKHLLPQIGLAFVVINSSIFLIDAIIGLSNLLIRAISGGTAAQAVWQSLANDVKSPSAYGLASLIIMTIFIVFSVILLIYYVGRIVTIYLGAVLAPLVALCWLLPSLRDMAITASKRYISAIFVLFIHVVILELAAALLNSVVINNNAADPLMSMIVGIATLVALLKTQGVMNQLSYVTIGPRMTRKIAERLVLNVSYLGGQAASTVSSFIPALGSQSLSSNNYHFQAPKPSNTISANSPIKTDAGNNKPDLKS